MYQGIKTLRYPKYNKKIKYSNEYYLIMIYYILNDVNNWNFYQILNFMNLNISIIIKLFIINLDYGLLKKYLEMFLIIIKPYTILTVKLGC